MLHLGTTGNPVGCEAHAQIDAIPRTGAFTSSSPTPCVIVCALTTPYFGTTPTRARALRNPATDPFKKRGLLRPPSMSRARRRRCSRLWSAARTIQVSYRRRRVRRAAFDAVARALLDEERDRDSFWILTDDELPGAEAFACRLCAFDARARRADFATLKIHRMLCEIPWKSSQISVSATTSSAT